MPIKMPSPDEMREHFHKVLKPAFDKALADCQATQDAYNAKRVEIMALEEKELKPLERAMHDMRIKTRAHELQQEMAQISRALGGQTALPEHKDQSAEYVETEGE